MKVYYRNRITKRGDDETFVEIELWMNVQRNARINVAVLRKRTAHLDGISVSSPKTSIKLLLQSFLRSKSKSSKFSNICVRERAPSAKWANEHARQPTTNNMLIIIICDGR